MEPTEEQIQLYVAGKLAKADIDTFEQQIENDPKLKQEVMSYQLAWKAVQLGVMQRDKERLLQYSKQLSSEDPPQTKKRPFDSTDPSSRNRNWVIWAISIAAVIVLIAIIVIDLDFSSETPPTRANTEITYEALLAESKGDMNTNDLRSKQLTRDPSAQPLDAYKDSAVSFFELGAYEQAITYFQKIVQDTLDDQIILYLGRSYLYADQPQAALETFDRNPNPENFEDKYLWYSALAHWQLKDPEAMQQDLCKLLDKHGYKQDKVQQLLQQLELSCE